MSMIVTADAKLSFDDIFEKDDNLLHNSNMLNLVSATKGIREDIGELEKEIEQLRNLENEIKAFVSTPENLQNTTEVQRLFEKARGRADRPRKRW